ncbi:hypothetical protein PESP_a3210 [Pseudoalteromonas espejiana DSM 9414]|nr:hypothetical protein PESP_a3210 [Pseudoalteromonas espejiana DSM 9414]
MATLINEPFVLKKTTPVKGVVFLWLNGYGINSQNKQLDLL